MRKMMTFWGAAVVLLFLSVCSARAAVGYKTTDDWGRGYNGQITITNTSAQALSGWTLAFDAPQAISGLWDATLVSHVGNHYVVKSAGWNDTISPGGVVTIGFGGAPGNVTAGPANFVLSGTSAGVPPTAPVVPPVTPPVVPPVTPPVVPSVQAGIGVTLTQTSAWSGGFGANMDIVNGGTTAVSGWTLNFQFTPGIQSLWNGSLTNQGGTDTVTNVSWNGAIPVGGKVTLGFVGVGTLTAASLSRATLNGIPCTINTVLGSNPTSANPTGSSIALGGGADAGGPALQITIPQGVSTFPLSLSKGGSGTWTVAVNNPASVSAGISGSTLQLTGLSAGRAGLRLQEAGSGATRYLGVRVRTTAGQLPGLPGHLAVGSVSEDTDNDLAFWHGFGTGAVNRYVDARYIYLNGGPYYGWSTWTNTPGGRAVSYIDNSRMMGMIPVFVWYNIPDGGESYYTDMQHVQSASYMQDYYKLLEVMLKAINTESPDDPVGIILEPDFLGYLAQNSGQQAAQIPAQVGAAYTAGVLQAGIDPTFPNTVQGVVQSINYIIARDAPQAFFGWQMNLWSSPAGGWTAPVPGKGIVHLTDTGDFATGRAKVYTEAKAITQYYLNAGVASYGAKFLSIDKYGLDAATAEAAAASDPAGSTWFWNADQWGNYLMFVKAMHDTSGLPITLWQLPVGHINSSQTADPYTGGLFPDLTNSNSQGEDSAPTFLFGDTFASSGPRLSFFSADRGGDAGVSAAGGFVTWSQHLSAAATAGVTMALFGAGVGGSTTNVGLPPTDSDWWITKAQQYLEQPVPLVGK